VSHALGIGDPDPSVAIAFLLFGGALALRASAGRLWALLPVIAAVIVVFVPLLAGELRSAPVQDLGKTADLSGRVEVWKFVTELITQHPLVGYGYGAFWAGMHGPAALPWKMTGRLDITMPTMAICSCCSIPAASAECCSPPDWSPWSRQAALAAALQPGAVL
jgi:hypothetical protein